MAEDGRVPKDILGVKMGQGRHCGERGSTGGESSNIFILGEDCMHTKHFSPVKHFLPGQHTSPSRFYFHHAFGPHFCKEKNEEDQNSPMYHHQFQLNCGWGWRGEALSFGGTSQEMFALPQEDSVACLASPHAREARAAASA